MRYDAEAYLIQVIDAAGDVHAYRYLMKPQPGGVSHNSGKLLFVDRPGGGTREYRYDETAHSATTVYFNLLTGIIDEKGNRYGTYKYDSQGRANQEFHDTSADFASLDYSYFYPQNPGSTIYTNAQGLSERRRFTIVKGIMRDAGRDLRVVVHACSVSAGMRSVADSAIRGRRASLRRQSSKGRR